MAGRYLSSSLARTKRREGFYEGEEEEEEEEQEEEEEEGNVHSRSSITRDRAERVAGSRSLVVERGGDQNRVRGVVVQFRAVESVSRTRLVVGTHENTTVTGKRSRRTFVAGNKRRPGMVEKLRRVLTSVRMRRHALDVRGE